MTATTIAVAAFVFLPTNTHFPYLWTALQVFPAEHPVIVRFQMVVERNRIMIDGQDQLIIRKQRIQHSEDAGVPFHAGDFAHVQFENMIFNSNSHSRAFFDGSFKVTCGWPHRRRLKYRRKGFVVL
ncbi:MAG: hypothetical protein ABS35_13350 [Kaistia sp. SCN 65-12]|nr:MAG: hypothetical protein ABS35_13350 [Kaistia sp. SCN 65-12]